MSKLSSELTRKSKYLSLLLRHDPGQAGITIDSAGWTSVKDLLHAIGWKMADLEEIVFSDQKKRYEFDQYKTKIRASQGHSIDVNLGYEVKVPPEYLYHGTSRSNADSIKQNGLLKMDRHDVHMFSNQKLAEDIAKKRRNNPVIVVIDSGKMHSDGFEFRLSTNNVWLTETVPKMYLRICELT